MNIIQNIKTIWNKTSATLHDVVLSMAMGVFGALLIYNTKDILDMKKAQQSIEDRQIETDRQV